MTLHVSKAGCRMAAGKRISEEEGDNRLAPSSTMLDLLLFQMLLTSA